MADIPQGWDKDSFSTVPVGPLGLIALEGSREIGEKINQYLLAWRNEMEDREEVLYTFPGYARSSFMLKAECPRFGTGEGKGVIRESVRGYDLYILVDVGNYGCTYRLYGQDYPMSPDDHYQDLKRVIAAAGGKGKRISVIMPLLYEGRQHKRVSRESLDCAVALQELEKMGVTNIITFDAHDPRVQNAVPLIGFENVIPTYQVLKALLNNISDIRIDRDHMMVISPDEGGVARNLYYATVLGLDLGMFYKRRDYSVIVHGRNPIVAHEYLGDSVEGKDIFISDDIISTGESILDIARELKRHKAGRIFVGVTFAFFTEGIAAFQEAYDQGIITRVLSSNLTYRSDQLKAAPWYIEVDMSKYLAYIIATLNHDRSISTLLEPIHRINQMLERYRDGTLK